MNRMGKLNTIPNNKDVHTIKTVKHSYVYRLLKKFLSIVSTILLVSLLVLGASMYYFNMKSSAAKKQGVHYNPPFGLYTIISGSMEPKIHVYDVVLASEVSDLSTIKVGDIITFISTWDVNYGSTVTHRVVEVSKGEKGEIRLATKGDANQKADGAYVTADNLVGKVLFRLPQLGRVQFFLATKMGWFIVVFVPAMGVIVWDVIKIFKLKVLKEEINNIDNVGAGILLNRNNTDESDNIKIVKKPIVRESIERKPIVRENVTRKPIVRKK